MFGRQTKWSPKEIEKWETARSKGRSHFVWHCGVCTWGLWVFLIMVTIDIVERIYFKEVEFDRIIRSIIVKAIVWPIGGYFFGRMLWNINEKAYHKAIQER